CRARVADPCARRLGCRRYLGCLLRPRDNRDAVRPRRQRLHRARRTLVARPRPPPGARSCHLVRPAASPRPGLRARRLALRRTGLQLATQFTRSPRRLPLARRRERSRQPHHDLRLAPPPRHPRWPDPRHRRGTPRHHLAARRPRAALPDRAVRRALPQNRLVTIVPRSEIADWSSTDWVARLTVRSVSCASS